MANWTGAARSNYFKVKDAAAFREWAKNSRLSVIDHDETKVAASIFAIQEHELSDGGWPTMADCVVSENCPDGERDLDLSGELAEHLVEGQVAILLEIGNERLRYITGEAIAVNHKGETVRIGLSDIYQEAQEAFGVDNITEASY